MAIKLNTKIFNAINSMIKGGVFTYAGMANQYSVESYLRMVKEDEAADWVQHNHDDFRAGLLQGFEIDNSQEAQLRDIKTRNSL